MRMLVLSRQYGGCQYYRQTVPARALRRAGVEVDHPEKLFYKLRASRNIAGPEPEWAKWMRERLGKYDILMVDRPIDFQQMAYFRGFCDNSPNCRLIIDFDDDFTNVPRSNPNYPTYVPGQEPFEAGLAGLQVAEMVTLSTETLHETIEPLCHNATHIPNLIDPEDWVGFPTNPERYLDKSFRVVYSGAAGHYEDLDIIESAIYRLIEEQPVPIRFFMIGSAPRWMAELNRRYPHRAVILPWHEFSDYPTSIAWGGFDLSLAPLVNTHFNRCKSNIKWLESGIGEIPLLCSDVGPYSTIPADCVGKVRDGDWYNAILDALKDESQRADWVHRSKQAVLDEWSIAAKGRLWYDLVQKVAGLSRITSLEATRLRA